jgi:bifunctional N-acetylglucosamine-1-phosphate-uridyltransferase/glucosamine-1-phosphate-acetyltransferase GlmU-like protein
MQMEHFSHFAGEDMRTHLLDGVTPLEHDQKILTMLKFAGSKASSDPSLYRVGIRNKEGQVYRIVEAQDLREAGRLATALTNLGLLEEDTPQAEEFSSTFSELR